MDRNIGAETTALNLPWRVPIVSCLLVMGTLCLISLLLDLGDPAVWKRFFHDDSFFYIKTAKNLALGLGTSFDGINLTNGFHPLYLLWLAGLAQLVELTGLTGLATVGLVDTALLLLALLALDRVLLLSGTSEVGRMLAAALTIYGTGFNDFGMNSRLLLPLAWLYVLLLMRWSDYDGKRLSLLGLLGALICLTRLEMWTFVCCLSLIGVAIPELLRRRRARAVAVVLACWLPAFATLGAYAVYNLHTFGHSSSISGWLKVGTGLDWARLTGPRLALTLSVGVLSALFFAKSWWAIRDQRTPAVRSDLIWTALNVFIASYMISIVVLARGGVGSWYFQLPISIVAGSLGLLADRLVFQRLREARAIGLTRAISALAIGGTLLAGSGFVAAKCLRQARATAVPLSLWMKSELPSTARIYLVDGSGAVGYFSERSVINGDGLINNFEYQEYLRSGRLKEYLHDQEVTHIAWDEYYGQLKLEIPVPLWDGTAELIRFGKEPPLVRHDGRFALYAVDRSLINSIELELVFFKQK